MSTVYAAPTTIHDQDKTHTTSHRCRSLSRDCLGDLACGAGSERLYSAGGLRPHLFQPVVDVALVLVQVGVQQLVVNLTSALQ